MHMDMYMYMYYRLNYHICSHAHVHDLINEPQLPVRVHALTGFEVMNTGSPLRTRTGCTVVLTCGGFGQSIQWRRFGQVHPLQNSTNQTVVTDVSHLCVYPSNIIAVHINLS